MASTMTFGSGVATLRKTLVNADSTNYVDVYDNSASSTPVRIEALNICSDDTSTVNIQFAAYSGAAAYLLGTVRAVTLSGTDGATARVNAGATVGSLAPDGVYDIWLAGGEKLQAKSVTAAVTAAKTVTITGRVRLYA